ncbi:MAG: NUDIX hydrolase [Candidatus Dormibacteraeota bacterium]|nr:NUDIX hydrolase [Candidatus Dormibacteraeota bacterium]
MRGRQPWELLLMRRPGGADFAPDAFVFPGGSVHPDDSDAPDPVHAAAVRELFEEVGILLARKASRFAQARDCEQVRSLLADGHTFGQALRALRLEPAYDRLVSLTRWVTPVQMRRRFDARFFLARMPAAQTVRPHEGEVADWMWIPPAKALSDRSITLVYATRSVLESVAAAADAAAVFARARRQREVPVVQPQLVQTAEGWEIVS